MNLGKKCEFGENVNLWKMWTWGKMWIWYKMWIWAKMAKMWISGKMFFWWKMWISEKCEFGIKCEYEGKWKFVVIVNLGKKCEFG